MKKKFTIALLHCKSTYRHLGDIGVVRIQFHSFLTEAVDREVSVSIFTTQVKGALYPPNRRRGVHQSWYIHFGEEKISSPLGIMAFIFSIVLEVKMECAENRFVHVNVPYTQVQRHRFFEQRFQTRMFKCFRY
jgi:hypothetical protein